MLTKLDIQSVGFLPSAKSQEYDLLLVQYTKVRTDSSHWKSLIYYIRHILFHKYSSLCRLTSVNKNPRLSCLTAGDKYTSCRTSTHRPIINIDLEGKTDHGDLGDNSGGIVHKIHVLSQRMQRPNVSTVRAYVPSQLMFRPDDVRCLAVTG